MPKPSPYDGIHQEIEECGREAALAIAKSRAEKRLVSIAADALEVDFTDSSSVVYSHPFFCMAGLPHRKPPQDTTVWHRRNGDFHLVIEPGNIIEAGLVKPVGVPFGSKARLILLYIQTHAEDDGTVDLGRSMTDWMRRLGLATTGGARGTIGPIKEQILRLSRARLSMHWTDTAGNSATIADRTPISAISLWKGGDSEDWSGTLHLSAEYMSALSKRRVPLSEHAISSLKSSSLALDLYCWLAYRMRNLTKRTLVPWPSLSDQIGADFSEQKHLAAAVRKMLPAIMATWPGLKVETATRGLRLCPSPQAVPPKKSVGWRAA